MNSDRMEAVKTSKTKPVKFGIASPGRWGTALVEAVEDSPQLSLAGVCSRDKKKAEAFAQRHGGRSHGSFEELISSGEIEAVVLPTPHFLHFNQAMAAMQAGLHVFVEKPMANTLEEAEEMERFSMDNGLVLGVGQQLRRTGAARRVRKMIESGELGAVIMARCALGATLLPQYGEGDWELDPGKIPGGALDNLGIHYADLLQYMLGPITKVCGMTTELHSPTGVPSAASAALFFENGVIGSLDTHQVSAYVSEVSIYGSSGVVHFKRAGQELLWQEVLDPVEAKRRPPVVRELPVEDPLPHTTALREELEDFARCIREGGQPEVGAREGIAALRVVRAIMESNRTGQSIQLEPR